MAIHFAFDYPVFGTKKNPKPDSFRERSVYYWWFQYMTRNDDYRKTCLNGGVGPSADLYKDFGDMLSVDFKTWWTANGARLFGEPPATSIAVITGETIDKSINAGRNTLVLSVPLDLPQGYLIKRFKEILRKHHDGKRGRRHIAASRSKYPTSGGKIDTDFLKAALQVWDMRLAKPEKPLWEIANDLKLGSKLRHLKPSELQRRGDLFVNEKKNILAATAGRHMKRAKEMIDATAHGKFPSVDKAVMARSIKGNVPSDSNQTTSIHRIAK